MNYEENMLHYGVKGMKWGVRKKREVTSLSPRNGQSKLRSLEKQMSSTTDRKKLKSLQKEYGKIEDSINYSKREVAKSPSNKGIAGVINRRTAKRKEHLSGVASRYHDKNSGKKSYDKAYNKNLKKFEKRYKDKPDKDPQMMAVMRTRAQRRNKAIAKARAGMTLAYTVAVADMTVGRNYTGRAMTALNNPAIRKNATIIGKNIVKTAMRSPVRVVDGSKLTDVVNMVNQVAIRR